MNKIANPFVRLILRSPLHRLMSASILLITYRGRKSGKEYTLPVQYVREDHMVYIIAGAAQQKTLWRNLRGGAPVHLLLAGGPLAGNADVLAGDADALHIQQALALYLQRFPAAAKMHNLQLGKDGSFVQADLLRAAASTVVVRVELDC